MENIIDRVLKAYGNSYSYIKNDDRNLYIVYSKTALLKAISNIKNIYDGPKTQKLDGSNCTNEEALQKFAVLEKIADFITTDSNVEMLFDYILYTKNNKFSKSTATLLFIPQIKNTWNGEYFSQYEWVLQLKTLDYFSDNIAIIELAQVSLCNRVSVNSVIDENCNFIKLEPIKRKSYLKQADLQPGTSYNDNKGAEHLYLGFIDNQPAYIKMTSKVKKEISKYTTLYDFLCSRFTANIKSQCYSGMYNTNPYERFSCNSSRKFLSQNTIYFDKSHSVMKPIKIKLPIYYDDSLKCEDESRNYATYTLDFS